LNHLIKDVNIDIDLIEINKQLSELEIEYRTKYRQILKFKHDPTSNTYQHLKCELRDLLSKRELLARG
jgi:hypothetical protein